MDLKASQIELYFILYNYKQQQGRRKKKIIAMETVCKDISAVTVENQWVSPTSPSPFSIFKGIPGLYFPVTDLEISRIREHDKAS